MWAAFVDDFRASPIPAEWQNDTETRGVYYDALDAAERAVQGQVGEAGDGAVPEGIRRHEGTSTLRPARAPTGSDATTRPNTIRSPRSFRLFDERCAPSSRMGSGLRTSKKARGRSFFSCTVFRTHRTPGTMSARRSRQRVIASSRRSCVAMRRRRSHREMRISRRSPTTALALIEALGETKAIVIGHDWGASTAYGAAALGGERVEKLVTIAIPHQASVSWSLPMQRGGRHFLAYKLPSAARRFAANDFAALRAIYARWSPKWTPSDDELAPARKCFADAASLDAAFGYYRALPVRTPAHLRVPIATPTIVFAGTDDRCSGPPTSSARGGCFTGPYTIRGDAGRSLPPSRAPRRLRRASARAPLSVRADGGLSLLQPYGERRVARYITFIEPWCPSASRS